MRKPQYACHTNADFYQKVLLVVAVLHVLQRRLCMGTSDSLIFCAITAMGDAFTRPKITNCYQKISRTRHGWRLFARLGII
jgi:hypothetical protein